MRGVRSMLLAGAALSAHPAIAADSLKFGPAPAWVVPQTIPDTSTKAANAPAALLLTDEQVQLAPGKSTSYAEIAIKLQNPQGLSAGNIALPWNPAFDTITVNKVHIIRGDKVIDVLAGGQTFTVARRETNLDAASLDGTLTAALQPEDLQVGDVIDFAATIEHSDPTLKNHLEGEFAAWNAVPIELGHVRISWPASTKLVTKESDGVPAPHRFTDNGREVLELTGHAVEPLVPPNSAPVRYRIGRLGELSDFPNWSELADLIGPLFQAAAAIPPSGPLRNEVETIRTQAHSPKQQAELALQLVENRVRYVDLSMGTGGLVPASAETTWARRFGDCKGKTALLLAILHELGIQADPVLAHHSLGDALAERLPMVGDFDHVFVRAHIGSKDYWLDGTRTGDTDLDSIPVPDLGWVLPLSANAQLVHLMPHPLESPDNGLTLDLDATAGVYASVPASADETIRGDDAVLTEERISSLSEAQRQQFFQTLWKTTFDFITFKSGAFTFEKAKRELHLTMTGDAKLDWSTGYFHVPNSSVGYHPNFDRQPGPKHDAPFAVGYPSYDKWIVRLHVPPSLFGGRKLGSAEVHQILAGVEYNRTAIVSGNVLTVENSARSIVPEISYKDAKAAEQSLIALSSEDVALPMPSTYRATAADLDGMKSQQPTDANALLTRGNTFMNNGRLEDAIADFTRALSMNDKDVVALADRALAYTWQRKWGLADKDLAAALSIDPNNAVALRDQGLEAELKDDCASAVQAYTHSLKSEADNEFALGHRGKCEAELHNDSEALADVDMALKQKPDWWGLRLVRIDLLARHGQKDAARAEADSLVKQSPESQELKWIAIAKVFARNGMQSDAMIAMDHAIALKPDASLYVTKADLRPLSDFSGRMADLDAALSLQPTDPGALAAKADLMASRSDLHGALAIYDEAIKKFPALSPLTVGRAILLYRLGRKSEAQKSLAEWRQLAGTASELKELCWWKATAGILLQSAEKDCTDALLKNPGFAPAMDGLGLIKLRMGRLDGAIAEYGAAISNGAAASSYFGRAIAYERSGDDTHAEADRAKALDLDPGIEAKFMEYGLEFSDHSATTANSSARAQRPN